MTEPRWVGVLGAFGVALSGGAVGAIVTWLIANQMTVNPTVVIALAGWLVTLVGWFTNARLSERAQQKMFLHNIINTAREKLIEEIRAEHEWASKVSSLGYTNRWALDRRRLLRPGELNEERLFWRDQTAAGQRAVYPTRGAIYPLLMALEEYELLFPETRRVREQISFFADEHVRVPFSRLTLDLMYDDRREASIAEMERLSERASNYSAVLEDLRVHIQNVGLAQITGRVVPLRQPQDPNLPIMIPDAEGVLDVIERGQRWPVRTWPCDDAATNTEPDAAPGPGPG